MCREVEKRMYDVVFTEKGFYRKGETEGEGDGEETNRATRRIGITK